MEASEGDLTEVINLLFHLELLTPLFWMHYAQTNDHIGVTSIKEEEYFDEHMDFWFKIELKFYAHFNI